MRNADDDADHIQRQVTRTLNKLDRCVRKWFEMEPFQTLQILVNVLRVNCAIKPCM